MSEPRVWQSWLKENSHKWLLYARQQTRSDADAEDVLQDALVKTWKACEGKISDETTSLVYTNIRRCAIDRGRSNSRREEREQKVAERLAAKSGTLVRVQWGSGTLRGSASGCARQDSGELSRGHYPENLGGTDFRTNRGEPGNLPEHRRLSLSLWSGATAPDSGEQGRPRRGDQVPRSLHVNSHIGRVRRGEEEVGINGEIHQDMQFALHIFGPILAHGDRLSFL